MGSDREAVGEIAPLKPEMLWGGRFQRPPDPRLVALTASVDLDMRLLPYDAAATKAHARTLVLAGFLGEDEATSIEEVCDTLVREWEQGTLRPAATDEDVHSVVERELTDRLGETGARIHAGRSRNDLVAADLRVWSRDEARALARRCAELVTALVDRAEENTDTVMAGYTHLQRAQPVTLAYHLCAHAAGVERDGTRFLQAAASADVSPLGAGALAGSTLGLDIAATAASLGFRDVFVNGMDAVADRDFACDLAYACAMSGVRMSRLATEMVMFTSSEFGFARLPDEWSTGSSMMPQKRNPDLAELVRGRASGGIGDLVALLGLLKSLPMAYNRDLQEDKTHLFATVDRTAGCFEGCVYLVGALEFDRSRLERAAEDGMLWATDVAEDLVRQGIPFRQAHARAGAAVAAAEAGSPADPNEPGPRPARSSVMARSAPGGPSPARVREQIETLRAAAARLAEAPPG